MNVDNPYSKPNQEKENDIEISEIKPDDLETLKQFCELEAEYKFGRYDPENDISATVQALSHELENGDLKIIVLKENNKIVGASSVCDLSNSTEDAWADGTLVVESKRRQGLGVKLAQEQERVAKEAGKNRIITKIAADNPPSIKLRERLGYQKIKEDIFKGIKNYTFAKELNIK